MDIEVGFSERQIAQALVVVKAFCRVQNKFPYAVEIARGSAAESAAWREAAIGYLKARTTGATVAALIAKQPSGEDHGDTDWDAIAAG